MRLSTVRIRDFKCINDSAEFTVSELTCFVGKNESGKTAILQALEKINPVVPARKRFEFVDFPRNRAGTFHAPQQGESEPAIDTTWVLDDEDRESIVERFGVDFVDDAPIRISRAYDNVTRWHMQLDERRLVAHLLRSSELDEFERLDIGESDTVSGLIKTLQSNEYLTPAQELFLEKLEGMFPGSRVSQALISHLRERLPRFLYFADYYRLPGRVSLDDLARRESERSLRQQDRMFMALLSLSGTTAKEVRNIGHLEELYARLEGISSRLSQQIFAYWSQNQHLKVDFRYDAARPDDTPPFNTGNIFSTRVQDTRQEVTVNFDERSSGFVWFFSFLVWLEHLRQRFGKRLIILLDEPAHNLHAKAQADLLRYFKQRLVADFQVLYTTHSPFMIDTDELSSIRMVEDGIANYRNGEHEPRGTVVREGAVSDDPDTMYPLQTALAYNTTKSLDIDDNVLLVPGPAHLLYLTWISGELTRRGRTGLDKRWTITPAGGLAQLSSFLLLFRNGHKNIALLTDSKFNPNAVMGNSHGASTMDFTEVFPACRYAEQQDAGIEDIFGRRFYVDLVNHTYGLKGNRRIPKRKRPDAPDRVVAEVTEQFCRRSYEYPEFDPYVPASYLAQHGTRIRGDLRDMHVALDQFERLFIEINALLSRPETTDHHEVRGMSFPH